MEMDSGVESTQPAKKPRIDKAASDDNVVQLTKNQVPEYLKGSEFYGSPEDDTPFPVPFCCFKSDITLSSEEDVRKLLSTVRFWGVKEILPGLVEFCRKNQLHEDVATEFGDELRYLKIFPLIYKMPHKGVMRHALLAGQLDLVLHLLDIGYCFSPYSVSHAIEGGDLECVKYVAEHAHTALMDRIGIHMLECAKYGRLDCLQYLHKVSGYNMTSKEIVECGAAAIRRNNVDCLRYIMQHFCYYSWHRWDSLAAELGRLEFDILGACNFAARNGHLDCLKFAHEFMPDIWTQSTCTAAATNGHFDCLKYAHDHGCPWDHSACSSAARNGHLTILQYLHENGCKWSKQTILQAIKHNQVACLQYALAQGCYHTPEDPLCTLAAEAGATECLNLLCERGYTCDADTMKAAVLGGHVKCVDLLKRRKLA